MPECSCGCGRQLIVFIHCANCFNKNERSDLMTALEFDDGFELYCARCGVPVYKSHTGSFHFDNLVDADNQSCLMN